MFVFLLKFSSGNPALESASNLRPVASQCLQGRMCMRRFNFFK